MFAGVYVGGVGGWGGVQGRRINANPVFFSHNDSLHPAGVHIFILGRYRYYDDHCTVVIVIEGLPNCCFKKHTFSHMVCTHARFHNMRGHVSCRMAMAFALAAP